MPTEKDIKLRQMREDELALVKQWAVDEGWNPGVSDLEFCYEAYPRAFYVFEVDGKTVGCSTIMRYSENFAFLGLLIVRSEETGTGYDRRVWNETMSLLKDCKVIRFYGALPNKDFYKPFFFRPIGYNSAYVMGEMQIREKLAYSSTVVQPGFFRQPMASDVASMVAYEEGFLKVRREALISSFLRTYSSSVLLATDESGAIMGFGAIRACVKENTFTVKPLYADNYEIAKAMLLELLRKLRAIASNTLVTLDIPLSNPHIERLVLDFDLSKYFDGNKECDTAVMSRPYANVILDTAKVYSRFSLEFS